MSPSACRACGAFGPREWSRKGGHTLARCPACASISYVEADGTPLAEPAVVYQQYHAASTFECPEAAASSLAALVAKAGRYRSTGRWLDVGFGEGGLLGMAEAAGWTCFGSEVSPHALAFGRRRGWTVSDVPGSDPAFVPGSFDIVTMIEVLEHLPQPLQALQEASAWLRPGGALYVTTPNVGSLNRLILGARWSIFCPPEHMTIWSARALRRCLVRLGLCQVRIQTTGLNPAEILARISRHPDRPVNRYATAVALSQALNTSPARRLVKRMANLVLNALGTGDTLKAWALRPGGRP